MWFRQTKGRNDERKGHGAARLLEGGGALRRHAGDSGHACGMRVQGAGGRRAQRRGGRRRRDVGQGGERRRRGFRHRGVRCAGRQEAGGGIRRPAREGEHVGRHRGHVGRRHGHPAHRRREGSGRRGLNGRGARILQERERRPSEPCRAGIVRDERERFSELAARDHGLAVQPQPTVRRLLRAPCRMEADGTRQPGLRQGRDAHHGGGNVDRPAGRTRRGRSRDHDGDAGHAAGHRFDGRRRGRKGDVGQGRGGHQGGRRHPRDGRIRP